ncbi:MAG: TrkA family potassium uptake protein [Lachnospiraceae bacterium]|nr:TrkA family potassium uptake protein [Lachnospiraceae bacterium]
MKNKTFAVLGLGKFGSSVAEALTKAGAEVLAVDTDEEIVNNIAPNVTHAVRADVCDMEVLKSLGISSMDGVVVAITGNLDASIMATIMAKELGVPYILAKANNAIHTKILEKVGANRVIVPEKESGIRMAYQLIAKNFLDIIPLSEKVSMVELSVKPEWVGKSLRQLNFRQKASANVVAMKQGEEVVVTMDPDKPLTEDMILWVTTEKKNMEKLM